MSAWRDAITYLRDEIATSPFQLNIASHKLEEPYSDPRCTASFIVPQIILPTAREVSFANARAETEAENASQIPQGMPEL